MLTNEQIRVQALEALSKGATFASEYDKDGKLKLGKGQTGSDGALTMEDGQFSFAADIADHTSVVTKTKLRHIHLVKVIDKETNTRLTFTIDSDNDKQGSARHEKYLKGLAKDCLKNEARLNRISFREQKAQYDEQERKLTGLVKMLEDKSGGKADLYLDTVREEQRQAELKKAEQTHRGQVNCINILNKSRNGNGSAEKEVKS